MPENNFPPDDRFKRKLGIIWVVFILLCITLYFLYAQDLDPRDISGFIEKYQHGVLLLYFAGCTIRGLTMIPGTPFLLAGIILFKDDPFLLLGVFLTSIFLTSALMFCLADRLGFSSYFEEHYPDQISIVRNKLNGKYGFLFILLWAFAPFTPTDLVCYVAGSIRMRFIKLVIPLLFGEVLICAFYIFNGRVLLNHWPLF
ncbi:MAG: VTT domain-containing protein [Daejeonella sp.]